MKIRKLINELKELELDKDERKEVIEGINKAYDSFEVGNYRFIDIGVIDSVLKEELLSDTYILGCFSAWFISDITGLDIDVIEKAQKSDNYELLGELMAKNIDAVVTGVVSNDGYGNHFSSYDGSELELEGGYYAFRIN